MQNQDQSNEPKLFNYFDKDSQEMLANAYRAITLTETWDFMKQEIDTYMWGKNPEIKMISEKMSELGYPYHSGSSFGWTMRHMQIIAQHGLEAHKNRFCKIEPSQENSVISESSPSTQEEILLPDSSLILLEPIIIPNDDIIILNALPSVPRPPNPPPQLTQEELHQIQDEISQKVNYSSMEEGVFANPDELINKIENAFTEFKEKTGRNMTYSEMRYMMG